MQYASYSNFNCLKETFHTALEEQQNIVIQASGLTSSVRDFADSVRKGLMMAPKQLECRFLYDVIGSELYEKICRQPEYYPTRTEAKILQRYAGAISRLTGCCHLMELGSGSSVKTEYLLSAYQAANTSVTYTPIDISASALKSAGKAIIAKRPAVNIIGLHGTYSDLFPLLHYASPALLIFLGSTIGNFTPAEERAFYQEISNNLQPGDYFLLGVDLLKDINILEAAYNDAAGVTSAFIKNYFARMNRELGCCLDLDRIEYLAFFNQDKNQIEIYAEFLQTQEIRIEGQRDIIRQGERILMEISRKFQLAEVMNCLHSSGFETLKTYTDENNWFGLLLLEKAR